MDIVQIVDLVKEDMKNGAPFPERIVTLTAGSSFRGVFCGVEFHFGSGGHGGHLKMRCCPESPYVVEVVLAEIDKIELV